MGKPTFNPETDVPSLAGKVILITGGTSGLGRETVLSFAGYGPAHIYFTGRSQSAADRVIQDVNAKHPDTKVTFIRCDLASLASVKEAAKEFLAKEERLDILMANAGIMALPPGLTEDGYEIQFGTNHLGHALLVKLLTPTLERTAKETGDVRVIWNTSEAYKMHSSSGIAFATLKTSQSSIFPGAAWVRYAQSKLANLLYAHSYAAHHPLITSVSIHPGISMTGLAKGTFNKGMMYVFAGGRLMSPQECAWNQQWAATAPKEKVRSGKYYEPVGVEGGLSRKAGDEALGEKLWEWTEKELEGCTL